MKEVIESVIMVEKESEARLNEARKNAAEIKKECDRELADRSRIMKEKFAAEYRDNTAQIRNRLEAESRKRLEDEKNLHILPDNLKEEPYNAIVQDVVDVIARTLLPQGE